MTAPQCDRFLSQGAHDDENSFTGPWELQERGLFYESDFQAESRSEFQTVVTDREVFRDLSMEVASDVMVYETCTMAVLTGRFV